MHACLTLHLFASMQVCEIEMLKLTVKANICHGCT